MNDRADPRDEPLTAAGKRYVVRDHVSVVLVLGLALGAAQTLGWYNAWLYAAVMLAVKAGSAAILVRADPAVLDARGTKHAMSTRERLFFLAYVPSALAMPFVAGLEAGRPGWSHHSTAELAVGLTLAIGGASFIVWALAHNAFFEPTVRLQRDRDHRVCTTGPYRLVRHPGYAGAVVGLFGVPLILGSRWAFVPAAIATVAFVVRTHYEDRMLRAELDGYEGYAGRSRYRLVPFVW
ncbi:MAG TPA: isoprenylcysteine carboxylmethyltransferase family protein [Sandaracinaceae bacterium LLY-WYZ-13_1]|nr:isoprenylcysteine carboxylmethyltransferase family protein [Sandaracinaceae bacterium LLY-WYZ-13_1]